MSNGLVARRLSREHLPFALPRSAGQGCLLDYALNDSLQVRASWIKLMHCLARADLPAHCFKDGHFQCAASQLDEKPLALN